MKVLVLIWSCANLFPIITPVILFPIFWIVAHFLRNNLEQMHSGLGFLFFCAALGGLTYVNFTQGPDHYFDFLERRGVEVNAKVTSVKKATSLLAIDGSDEVGLTFQNETGTTFEMSYVSHDRRFYPPVEQPVTPPEPGDRIRIRYFPGAESGFVVLSDSQKSEYGRRIICGQAKNFLLAAEKGFRAEDFPSGERRQKFKTAIGTAIGLGCLDFKETERIRAFLPRL